MQLSVYKGFDEKFLQNLKMRPLVDTIISQKLNILLFDKKVRKQLNIALLNLEDEDCVWVTYEEYTLIKGEVETEIINDGLQVVFYLNNIYPEYYPIPFSMSEELIHEIKRVVHDEEDRNISLLCKRFLSVYNTLIEVNGAYYGSFYNYEYEYGDKILLKNYYTKLEDISDTIHETDYDIFLNGDIETYLRDLEKIRLVKPKVIGIQATKNHIAERIEKSLRAYCRMQGIRLVKFTEKLPEESERENELIAIAKQDMKIANFQKFRMLKFYENPDINKDIIELSQVNIIQEIIQQAENSYNTDKGRTFRDIFITAPTGAGKSVMFQIPAVYLAKKYHKLTIIIEPVKALMQDQKEKLNQAGFTRVEAFNSDLITQVEKEAVLKRIKEGEVDLLYLSPETLLSYSIETIIGDREIGLVIVDEAHIVTTWGIGFRPDYWYLGGYINRLRNQVQTVRGKKRKVYHFPVCAFTATAINGGPDDSVSETIISLYMENPIKYIGYARRDNIQFQIIHQSENKRLSKSEYEEAKANCLKTHIDHWLTKKEKTIVYFPYATLAGDAAKGVRSFGDLNADDRIGVYIGRNIDNWGTEAFNMMKNKNFEDFRSGKKLVMFATKAFGMGVDVDDIQNVYHYAVTGNLCDYVQEIGRAARKAYIHGHAIMDIYNGDRKFMNSLFGMSQIRQYQITKVIEGIYNTYKSKGERQNFLISPESFTYIFNGKGVQDEGQCINKLKICLLMLEKDFYDKYNFKVLISRPQSVFTKAFVCIQREYEDLVLQSKYASCFRFVEKGRNHEKQADGSYISDMGDIYIIDLKRIWEIYYPNISFPQFKYFYFNRHPQHEKEIMPTIRAYIMPRQKVNITARNGERLSNLREQILGDFEYIADRLYSTYGKQYFTTEDFIKILKEHYGVTKARIIANSLFDLVDPQRRCVKWRSDIKGKMSFSLSRGDFKEYMRKAILKSQIVNNISLVNKANYSGYLSLATDETSMIALKLLSIFDYITYEILGGSEPEIFVRLNDPSKIRNIALGRVKYSNSYVMRSAKKHERDVSVLSHFLNDLVTDKERWDFIEDYFLGRDVLQKKSAL